MNSTTERSASDGSATDRSSPDRSSPDRSATDGSATDGSAVQRVAALRRFDRFYTDPVRALRSRLLDTPYTLTEARVLYELAQRGTTAVADLRRELDVDAGYLSRILRRFEADGLTSTSVSTQDGRRREVSLTGPGRKAFGELDRLSERRAA